MPNAVVLLLSAALIRAQAPAERTALVLDPRAAGIEQVVVGHLLTQSLLADASVRLVPTAAISGRELRAGRLRRRAQAELATARSALEGLAPEEALTEAAKARQKLGRVAALVGDVAPLAESLACLASALAMLGELAAADAVVAEQLVLSPDWTPDPAYFHPAMLARVLRVKDGLAKRPQQAVRLEANDPNAAIYADGALVGTGHAELRLVAGVPHYFVAFYLDGAAAATSWCGQAEAPDGSKAITIDLLRHAEVPEPANAAARRYAAEAIAHSENTGLTLKAPSAPLRALSVDSIVVLSCTEQACTLTDLTLKPLRRRRQRQDVALTRLHDISRVLEALLAEPPALVPVPAAQP